MCVETGFCTCLHCRAQILERSQEKNETGGLLQSLCVCNVNCQVPWHSSAPSAALLQRARTKITRVEKLQEPLPTHFYSTKYNS